MFSYSKHSSLHQSSLLFSYSKHSRFLDIAFQAQQEFRMKNSSSDENSHSALNLSNATSGAGGGGGGGGRDGGGRHLERERERKRAPSSPLSINAGDSGINQELKKKFRDNLGVSFVSPTTGKKRVQCNVCMKTFCDKGALKIHFSAVHLREMHKCTVDGCQAAFPSKRSRDRHAANLNLHRKLLSTSSAAGQSNSAPASPTEGDAEPKISSDFFGGLSALNGALRDQLLSRIYANAEASMMGLTPFLPPPPSLFLPALGHGPLTPAASAFLRHHNNNNGKSSMDTASPPPSSPSDRPDEESAGATTPPAALYPCTVDNCTKIFVSPHLRNAHCQDDHDNSAAVRNSI